jgi:hypothetical protein
MADAYAACGYKSEVRVAHIDRTGARIISDSERAPA